MNENRPSTPYVGKIICALIGMLFLGPIGFVVGLIIGHFIDKSSVRYTPENKAAQQAYIESYFAVMGYVAKLDGQVSQREIHFATLIMNRMRLNGLQREMAQKAFYQGKSSGFNLDEALDRLSHACGRRRKLLYSFINSLVQMAYADGVVKNDLKPVLQQIARRLGLMPLNFGYYDAIFGFQQRWQQGGYQGHSQQGGGYQQGPRQAFSGSANEAYTVLGVSSKASNAEVKKAYRKLMSEYHPDKLMSKGLSETEMQKATEKVQKIKAAYEAIKSKRGL